MRMRFAVDIAVTINHRDIVLITRTKEPHRDRLCLPGGKVEPTDEDAAASAAREAFEEIGLCASPHDLEYLTTLDAKNRDARGHWISTVFTIDLPSAEYLRAGDDAKSLHVRSLDSLRPEEMGFDHWAAIAFLRDRYRSDTSGVDHLIRTNVRTIPDFPKPGIQFKDITPLLGNADALRATAHALARICTEWRAYAIVGLESRGFIFGGAVAHELGLPFVPIRKPGKLPAETVRIAYDLEYGSNTLEMHADAIAPGTHVAIIDDLLATGGTAAAAGALIARVGGTIAGYAFPIELAALSGRARLNGAAVHALVTY